MVKTEGKTWFFFLNMEEFRVQTDVTWMNRGHRGHMHSVPKIMVADKLFIPCASIPILTAHLIFLGYRVVHWSKQKAKHDYFFKYGGIKSTNTGLQIRRSNKESLGIIIHMSSEKHIL